MEKKLTSREREILLSMWQAGELLTISGLTNLHPELTASEVQKAINRLLEKKYATEVAAVYRGKIISRFYKPTEVKLSLDEKAEVNTY